MTMSQPQEKADDRVRGPRHDSIFAVGDIHGCYRQLEKLLARLPIRRGGDTLVFLGDYLDRGVNARKVLDIICELSTAGYKVIGLLGNHEYLLLEYHKSGDPALVPYLRKLGLEQTLESYGDVTLSQLASLTFLPSAHRDFLLSLLPFFETENYLFVHAGINPGLPLSAQGTADLCEIRETFLRARLHISKTVVFGHTPFVTPYVTADKIGIDTGAVYGNLLTAVQLPARQFYHAG